MRRFTYAEITNRPTKPREPLYTLTEIADRLGVDYDNLKVCMHTSKAEGYPKSPKPVMRVGSRSSARMSAYMYSLSDFKRWMKALQEFKITRQGDTT